MAITTTKKRLTNFFDFVCGDEIVLSIIATPFPPRFEYL